ncbi:zeta toxin family protein [Streptomyces sp. JCM17656]|nr:zeta toxin family protein [Streptomyces sp. JCM17656]
MPQANPVVVHVMAQPGAGKSENRHLVRGREKATRICGDEFKVEHPAYLMLLAANPAPRESGSAPSTRHGSGAWRAWSAARAGIWSSRSAPGRPRSSSTTSAPFVARATASNSSSWRSVRRTAGRASACGTPRRTGRKGPRPASPPPPDTTPASGRSPGWSRRWRRSRRSTP